MDLILSIFYIILFILIMVFIFSMALLTPILDKKNMISLIAISFIIGAIGGAFFISPIYDELPYIIGSSEQIVNGQNEHIIVNIPVTNNIKESISGIKSREGVLSVEEHGIYIKTDKFSSERKQFIESKISKLDSNIKIININTNGEIQMEVTSKVDVGNFTNSLSNWLSYTGDINVRSKFIEVEVTAEASKVSEIEDYLNRNSMIVSSVYGPVQESINKTKETMPDSAVSVLISGIIGVLIAFIGMSFDKIKEFFKPVKKFILKIIRRK
ncbi:MAG: hypothetical protein ACRC1M_08590 [Methanobacteriaceae archaeon]